MSQQQPIYIKSYDSSEFMSSDDESDDVIDVTALMTKPVRQKIIERLDVIHPNNLTTDVEILDWVNSDK
jgi:hypothetical protein